jgi:hypothetical protein
MKIQNRPLSCAEEEDRAARALAFPNRRARRHWNRVGRLRYLLNVERLPDSDSFRRVIAIKGYYPAHRDLFTLREFADAVCASPKVIRAAERWGMIKSERLPGKKARKLFFTLAAIRRFFNNHYVYGVRGRAGPQPLIQLFPDEWCSALRSVKIALNPHFVRGNALTIQMAMARLGISRRTVRHYLKSKVLKKIRCGHQTVLITRVSLERLYARRCEKKT